MRISELDYSKLTDEDKYNLIMSNLVNYGEKQATDDSKADIIVVLGCSPRPLKARVKKMMELFKKGYSDSIVLSGGKGWQKLITQTPAKKPILIQAIKDVIKADLLGDNPSKIEIENYELFRKEMERLIGKKQKTYQEVSDERKMEMTEEEFMRLIIQSNGGLYGAHVYHEPFSTNTKENAEYLGKIFDEIKRTKGKEVNRVMLITTAYHCTRAKLSFMKFFPNLDIKVCPSTEDLEEQGLALNPDIMKDEKQSSLIRGEADKIIKYSAKGDIANVELAELVSPDIVKSIESRQKRKRENVASLE